MFALFAVGKGEHKVRRYNSARPRGRGANQYNAEVRFIRDLFRRKAPPPDERPENDFPHVFLTPRALKDISDYQKKRGRLACVLLQKQKPTDEDFDYLVTPYGNLIHDDVIRVTCPQVPAYVTRGLEDEFAGFVIDHVPLPGNPPGFRTPNNPVFGPLPQPSGAVASDPGLLRVCWPRFAKLHPELFADAAHEDVIQPISQVTYQMLFGDACPALVVAASAKSVIVSAFSADIDCVVLLRFPPELAAEHDLRPGMRLITLNSYRKDPDLAADLKAGPNYSAWTNYQPMIAEFLTNDPPRLKALHDSMPDWALERCRMFTNEAAKQKAIRPRDGRPLRSVKPVE